MITFNKIMYLFFILIIFFIIFFIGGGIYPYININQLQLPLQLLCYDLKPVMNESSFNLHIEVIFYGMKKNSLLCMN
jgi:hypothetical protein